MRRMARTPTKAVEPAPAQPVTKTGLVLDLMRRAEGATIKEMTTATGWQPHSTRAVLTGLRKKGHVILKDTRENVTFYRLAEPA